MDLRIFIALITAFFTKSFSLVDEPKPISNITVMGTVFCDTCSKNSFSKQSYFLPGVEVHVECKFRANSTTKPVSFTANRTTDKYGVYTFEVPFLDGFECREGHEVGSFCQASLLGSSSSFCNVPGLNSTEDMAIKSKQDNLCIYSLNALNYRPPKRYIGICGPYKGAVPSSLNSSEFFLPYYPPLDLPFPPLPSFPLPHLSPLPPFPSLPFPPFKLPPMPFPNPPPAFPFPFSTFPPLPPTPSLFTPSPPPPVFSLRNPRSWFPFLPPSPPNKPQNKQP
ncbi:uncharacterized protein LOC143891024 [Tasmannia lanceolata]|uniref:uncharacterized protein LOC143891024 n=1 Tax=Tasmannia lanceolata TaxID=3420 RepID=UPI004063F9E9